jgi:uncharacterized iron-regulated membrane protein
MDFKMKIRFLHKWLGLISGLIVFIVSITGCIFCFHDEIKDITRKEWRFVQEENKPYILPSILQEKAKKIIPKSKSGMVAYHGKNRSAVVYTHNDTGNYYVYFNPYSGKYLKTENPAEDFFIIVEYIHLYLLLPDYIGKHIVGGATLIFIILLISGIIQWWPKKKKDLKNRLKVKWSAKWRRVNYDWHNVSGFYIATAGLVLAITGLVFTYEWVGDGIYYTANLGGNRTLEEKKPEIDTTKFNDKTTIAIDKAMAVTFQKNPESEMYFITTPEKMNEPITTGAYPYSLRYDHQDNYYFHPKNGQLLKTQTFSSKSLGLKIVEMDYGIHTGQILNLPGKILAFTVSLIVAALPITGFVIWYGRRKKAKKKV